MASTMLKSYTFAWINGMHADNSQKPVVFHLVIS